MTHVKGEGLAKLMRRPKSSKGLGRAKRTKLFKRHEPGQKPKMSSLAKMARKARKPKSLKRPEPGQNQKAKIIEMTRAGFSNTDLALIIAAFNV